MKRAFLSICLGSLLFSGCRTAPENTDDLPEPVEEITSADASAEQEVLQDQNSVQDKELLLLLSLTESLKHIQHSYAEEVDTRDLVYSAIDGMLQSLDPFSSFLSKESYRELEEDSTGHFSGLGVTVNMSTNGVQVVEPIENSPAEKAGIKPGDIITAVGKQTISPGNFEDSMTRLRGKKGTSVQITVKKPSGKEQILNLVRDDVKISSVRGLEDVGDGIFYVRITQFSQSVPSDFLKVLQELSAKKARGLILDLRNNPGGVLEAATAVASLLLPEGKDIVSVKGRRVKNDTRQFRSIKVDGKNVDIPIVLLVDGGSASAAEILSGALKAHQRARLVGEKTFGKASVQTVIPLQFAPGCAMRLTTAHYYTPDGKLIHGHGITPDEVVPISKADRARIIREQMEREINTRAKSDYKKKRNDPQFDRARKILLRQISGQKKADK